MLEVFEDASDFVLASSISFNKVLLVGLLVTGRDYQVRLQ